MIRLKESKKYGKTRPADRVVWLAGSFYYGKYLCYRRVCLYFMAFRMISDTSGLFIV